ncbi:MAG: hypothetical protein DIJKHBIC_01772 [Thermoanaerobaculia bacterium]|nr:hypothetical protein [Thermoanaerobaculia bacterium]
MIERLEFREELGRSPHALTTLRFDAVSGKLCVVKSLDLGKVTDLRIIEMFRREAKVLRGLDHPRIPKLLDMFEERGPATLRLHLVQEYVEGENLALARSKRSFSEEEVIGIARDLLGVLRYLHSFSPPIIHRDIKPGNVVLSKTGVHLIDFSGVRDTLKQDRDEKGGFTIVGSYGYMPFEQYEGRALPASDIYALGMTLVFLVTGLEPSDLERQGMRLAIPSEATLSPRFRAVLSRMIEPDARNRYQNVEEVESALTASKRVRHPRRRAAAFAVLGTLALAAAVLLFLERRPRPSDAAVPPPGPVRKARPARGASLERTARTPVRETFELTPPDPVTSKLVARGLITYASEPVHLTFPETPGIRINAAGGGELNPPMRYEKSTLEIFDLKPGGYFVSALRGSGEALYHGGLEILVEEGRVVEFEFHVSRQIQFERLEREEGVQPLCETPVRSPVKVQWKPFEPGTFYDYDVYENRCDGKGRARPLLSGSTQKTMLTLELPESGSGMRYQVNIGARRGGTWAGNGGILFVVAKGPEAR